MQQKETAFKLTESHPQQPTPQHAHAPPRSTRFALTHVGIKFSYSRDKDIRGWMATKARADHYQYNTAGPFYNIIVLRKSQAN
eukprot:scaffold2782_cov182-Amphora_coffeaeformis.AAC.3